MLKKFGSYLFDQLQWVASREIATDAKAKGRALRLPQNKPLEKRAHETEVALRTEIERLERAKQRFLQSRPVFFTARENLELARFEYERALRDMQAATMHMTTRNVSRDLGGPAQKLIEDIDARAGAALRTISLGLTEAFWTRHAVPDARTYLNNKSREYRAAAQELEKATHQMELARGTLASKIAQLRYDFGKGTPASGAELHLEKRKVQTQIARRLLAEAHDPDSILEMTGYMPSVLSQAAVSRT